MFVVTQLLGYACHKLMIKQASRDGREDEEPLDISLEELQRKLAAGELDDRKVEIVVETRATPVMVGGIGMRIFPEMCPRTTCPFSSFTLNIALGSVSRISPCIWIVSSFAISGPENRLCP